MDIIYVNLSPKMQSTKSVITAEDVAEITGRNQEVVEKARKAQIYEFASYLWEQRKPFWNIPPIPGTTRRGKF